jgi:hypothetical protein
LFPRERRLPEPRIKPSILSVTVVFDTRTTETKHPMPGQPGKSLAVH